MEQEKKKGGAGRVVLIILGVLAALGFAGYLGLRALVQDQMKKVNNINLSVAKGQEAPDFALPLTDGSEAKLSELLKDKEVVVLNIFASWCGPCEKEFPDMEKTYQKYKDKMEIVAVSGDLVLDEMEDMVKYKEEHNLSFLIGMKNESIDSLKVGGFPTTYIIDRNGRIVFSQSSAFLHEGDFEKVVTSLMGDDYEGKQVALYNFYVTNKDKDRAPGIEIRLYNDTVDETITTGEDGIASYFTQDAQDLKIEILNLPDGYTSNADSITLGIESGTKMITIEKK
ncbi:MAG: TlpA family protein disulfide reductase [Lachnospiraceae bacterium]|nr:TlpA family protein disulfide reductase [Lachnospiraceae bacterium]